VLEVGLTASLALEKATTVEDGIRSAYAAAGMQEATASSGDPLSARVQARRRRIANSGLPLIHGGAQ